MAQRLLLQLAGQPGGLVELLRKAIDFVAAQEGLPADWPALVAMVLDEVLANIIAYGRPNGAPPDVEVGIGIGAERLVIEISDDGIAFDPLTAAPPRTDAPLGERGIGGLGIMLMTEMMDGVAYRRDGGRNHLILTKTLPG